MKTCWSDRKHDEAEVGRLVPTVLSIGKGLRHCIGVQVVASDSTYPGGVVSQRDYQQSRERRWSIYGCDNGMD